MINGKNQIYGCTIVTSTRDVEFIVCQDLNRAAASVFLPVRKYRSLGRIRSSPVTQKGQEQKQRVFLP